MKSYGGKKDDVATRAMLSELFGHELAAQFCWTSEHSTKTPAKTLLLIGLMESMNQYWM